MKTNMIFEMKKIKQKQKQIKCKMIELVPKIHQKPPTSHMTSKMMTENIPFDLNSIEQNSGFRFVTI